MTEPRTRTAEAIADHAGLLPALIALVVTILLVGNLHLPDLLTTGIPA